MKYLFASVATLLLAVVSAGTASAQAAVVLVPDIVSGTVTVRLSTNVSDNRVFQTCIYRIDPGSPDVNAQIACTDIEAQNIPTSAANGGVGWSGSITVPVTITTGETQIFGARNFASELVDGVAVETFSTLSPNSGVMIGPISAPLFIVIGS
jgi:hypothetical protein